MGVVKISAVSEQHFNELISENDQTVSIKTTLQRLSVLSKMRRLGTCASSSKIGYAVKPGFVKRWRPNEYSLLKKVSQANRV